MIQFPYIHPNAITAEEADRLVAIIKQAKHANRNDSLRTEIPAIRQEGADRELLKDIVGRCTALAIQGLNIDIPIYPEYVLLQANKPGDGHTRHADNTKHDGQNWVPNHTPQRTVSAGLYLNNNYRGGELVFPDHCLTLKPLRALVAFPSNESCIHEVNKVRSGIRYSIIVWWTGDKTRQERWA